MGNKLGIFAVAAVLVFTLAGAGLASPPVPPPMEGFIITTNLDVNMGVGDFIEDEEFTWTYVADLMNDAVRTNWEFFEFPFSSVDPMFLAVNGEAAQVRYDEQLRSVDSGAFQINKAFAAFSHEDDDPNLTVDKDYAWTGQEGSGITNVENRERVGLSIVANGNDPLFLAPNAVGGGGGGPNVGDNPLDDVPSLCPWVRDTELPATNEFIAMGSRTTASGATGEIISRTRTDATSTGPPSLNHNISAEGTGASAEAEMRLGLMEGDGSVDALPELNPNPPFNWMLTLVAPDLVSLAEYEEYTGAFGIFEFNKQMHYHSEIPDWQMPEPWFEILDGAPALP